MRARFQEFSLRDSRPPSTVQDVAVRPQTPDQDRANDSETSQARS